jgi:hypothetical protein
MDDLVSFASPEYWVLLAILAFARATDFLSTWVATPNLVLEGNPIAKFLGWKFGILINVAMCFGLAFWPVSAVAVSTTSVLVAARNFQSAWLMRSMGEEIYRDWYVTRVRETRITLYLFCLAGNTMLTAAVGFAVMYFSTRLVSFAIGLGVIGYSAAVAFYTLLATFRLRRAAHRQEKRRRVRVAIAEKAALDAACACGEHNPAGK